MSNPKHTVAVRIKTHCTGCGTSREIESLSEPIIFESTDHFRSQFDEQFRRLEQFECPTCRSKTEQISWFDGLGFFRAQDSKAGGE